MGKTSLTQVQASNATISSLPPGLVAVFVGATSGIGEAALKEFVKNAKKPKCYLVGRSEQAANRIIGECKSINSDAHVVFMQADVSLIREVDRLCEDIKGMEDTVNILFLSAGAPLMDRSSTCLAAFNLNSFLEVSNLQQKHRKISTPSRH